jgi:hypothetical protein
MASGGFQERRRRRSGIGQLRFVLMVIHEPYWNTGQGL